MTDRMRCHCRAGLITAALTIASSVGIGTSAPLDLIQAPPVPHDIEVPAGNAAYLVGHATGTQAYICLPSAAGFAWTFFAPQATLFQTFTFLRDVRQQIVTHFLSPNPSEGGMPRATWQNSFDTSAVWAKSTGSTTDPSFVAAGAIPWLLLQEVGLQRGPAGGAILAQTTYIQRLNTAGGVAPSSGCSQSANLGSTALVPYTSDYFFYKKADVKN